MQRLLYPLIASALITIVSFLLTFEKGQNIVRGLFGYEFFALLLFIIFIKERLLRTIPNGGHFSLRGFLKSSKQIPTLFITYSALLILLIAALFTIAWIDLQNQLAFKNWETNWYGIIPFATCSLAIAMVWKIKSFQFSTISFILFTTLFVHLAALNYYPAQPLAQFPIIDYLERTAPKPVQRTNIADDFKEKWTVSDSVSITKKHVDTTRNNVIILVESWGIPLDIKRFEKQLKTFNVPTSVGIHNRMYSRTRTAEREDLIQTFTRDSTGHRDTTFLPQTFANIGYKITFLFGGDSMEQWRHKYIANMGFNDSFYGKKSSIGHILNDAQMVAKIDNILADTTQKHFIAWTTHDTKFPLPGFSDIYNNNADIIDSAYTTRLSSTLAQIAILAQKHPETRFIIQGDHNPILAPIKFQERFYKRWVPFMVLN